MLIFSLSTSFPNNRVYIGDRLTHVTLETFIKGAANFSVVIQESPDAPARREMHTLKTGESFQVGKALFVMSKTKMFDVVVGIEAPREIDIIRSSAVNKERKELPLREEKFCLQRTDSASREQLAIIQSGRPYIFSNEPLEGHIPIGDVPYCEKLFGEQPDIKDFYPKFLTRHLKRTIYLRNGLEATRRAFVKSATEWKSDKTKIVEPGEIVSGQIYVSDVVKFTNEWRVYVASGRVFTIGWYDGDHEDLPFPREHLSTIKWPNNFSGAIDFGLLKNGTIALVEAHAPMACGWYGDNHDHYAAWQSEAWHNRDYWLKQNAISQQSPVSKEGIQ